MIPADRATLLHAAELLERVADRYYVPSPPEKYEDLLATAKALREMASAAQG